MQNQPEIATAAPAVEPDHMKEIILRYVQEEISNPYALMISGDWGCGKTYYLKEEIRLKLFEEPINKKLLYVSLNGVSSVSDIYEQLFSEKYKAVKFLKDNKVARITLRLMKSGLDVALRAFKVKSGNGNFDDFETEPGDLPSITGQELADFSNSVIVFDDLERISSKLGIGEVLGFINTNFVEHDKIKVIIVSDEKKIKDANFGKIKEKMIGRTLEFKPRVIEIAKNFIKDPEAKLDIKYKSFLEINELFIIDRIQQAEITNLRTLFFFFDSLYTIVQPLSKDLKDYFREMIIHQTLLLSNEYKDGRLTAYENLPSYFSFTWGPPVLIRGDEELNEERKNFRRRYSLEGIGPTPILKEIHDFIINGYLESSKLISLLEKRLIGEHTKEVNAILNLHPNNYHLLTNEAFIVYVSEVIEAVKEKKYNFIDYQGAFRRLHEINQNGFLPNEAISINSFEELKEIFIQNISSIRNTDFVSIHSSYERQTLKKFQREFKDSYPDLVCAFEAEVELINAEFQQRKLIDSFNQFKTNPIESENWKYIENFVQNHFQELTADLINNLESSHFKVNQYATAFGDWSKETTNFLDLKFDVDLVEANFAKMIEQLGDYEKDIVYKDIPLNKLFNGYLLRNLHACYEKALHLSAKKKAEQLVE